MKRLIIVRHAKAEQGGFDHDFKRELSEKGKDDAHRISNDLKEWEIFPDYIISSPAIRALTTARIYAEELNFPKQKIIERKGLYFDFTTAEFVDMLHEIPNEFKNVFVFGHNPFMYFMVENMCNGFAGDMPTCSTVVIDFPVNSWKETEARKGNFFLHLYPKIYNIGG
jgi:phosphohistidine phosphatase